MIGDTNAALLAAAAREIKEETGLEHYPNRAEPEK